MSHFGEGVDPDSNCGTTYVNYYTVNESYMVADTKSSMKRIAQLAVSLMKSKCLPQ